jgi:hypothetical protein
LYTVKRELFGEYLCLTGINIKFKQDAFLKENTFVQGISYFINKIPMFIFKKEKELNVQNINTILLRVKLRDIFKIAGRLL